MPALQKTSARLFNKQQRFYSLPKRYKQCGGGSRKARVLSATYTGHVLKFVIIRFFTRFPTVVHSGKMYIRYLFSLWAILKLGKSGVAPVHTV